MKIYVAGKWGDKERVRTVIDVLMANGHTITHDWTAEEAQKIPYFQVPLQDLHAVKEADCIVMVLVENLGYVGAWVELGAALAYRRPVYVIMGKWLYEQFNHAEGPFKRPKAFLWHPLVHKWEDFPNQRAVLELSGLFLAQEPNPYLEG